MSSRHQFSIQHCENNSAGLADAGTRCLEGHCGGATALHPLRDGHIASASHDNTIRLWDPASGTAGAHLKGTAEREIVIMAA